MALITKAPRGTKDILPNESYKWQVVEDVMRRVSSSYRFKEIRTPVFEHTNLFERGVGQGTDVVQKEMYTFEDKGKRSITLRPEGTAGVVRAILEHGLYNDILPIKTYYFANCYRYERPQAGRLREFYQFGVEVIGSKDALADAQIICLANSIYECLGVNSITLEINTIGCPDCRKKYNLELKKYFESKIDNMCSTCKERLKNNPMRILDCKNNDCIDICKNAPIIIDYICSDCDEHFKKVKEYLDLMEIEYKLNPKIVRGLDYYTKTVFEFIYENNEEKFTVCGGGRYDLLTQEMGGPELESLGFGIGMNRLMYVLQQKDNSLNKIEEQQIDIYIANIGEDAKLKAFELTEKIRTLSLRAECDMINRSLKAQLKFADKIAAKFSMVIGEDEILNKKAVIKNMKTGNTENININDDFIDQFMVIYQNSLLDINTKNDL